MTRYPYGYTGEWYGGYTHLLHLRARWYAPENGTFLSVDPVESEPPYQYVRGNVVNRVDPSGRSGQCASGQCGPNITDWFAAELQRHNSYGRKMYGQRIMMMGQAAASPFLLKTIATTTPYREIVNEFSVGDFFPNTNLQGVGDHIPLGSVPATLATVDFLGRLEYGLYGLAVQYSEVDYYKLTEHNGSTLKCGGCPLPNLEPNGDIGQHKSVTLCGRCIDASDLGNIMFGFGGQARGYSFSFSSSMAYVFNAANDLRKGGTVRELITNPDPRATMAGWIMGASGAFHARGSMCGMLNLLQPLSYNDNALEASGCTVCTEDVARPDNLPGNVWPSSLQTPPEGYGSTIKWFKELYRGGFDLGFKKISPYLP